MSVSYLFPFLPTTPRKNYVTALSKKNCTVEFIKVKPTWYEVNFDGMMLVIDFCGIIPRQPPD